MAFEQNKPIEIQDVKDKLDEKVNTSSVLTFEEIQATTDLTGKVASAEAIKQLGKRIFYYKFNLPSNISSLSVGTNIALAQVPFSPNEYLLVNVIVVVFQQQRNIDSFFEQIAFYIDNGNIVTGASCIKTLGANYNNAEAYAVFLEK